jgi:hypothetical protein
MAGQGRFDRVWLGTGKTAQCPPNPAFPHGMDLDLASDALAACTTDLPYPAPEVGAWKLTCTLCGTVIGVTAAGRPDDPRSVTVACKLSGGTRPQ